MKYVVLQEDLTQGQRVESFRIVGEFASGREYVLFRERASATSAFAA